MWNRSAFGDLLHVWLSYAKQLETTSLRCKHGAWSRSLKKMVLRNCDLRRYELFLTQIFSFCTLYKISSLVYSLSASPLYTVCVWIISVIYTHTCMSTASKAKLCKSFFLFCLFWTILFDYIYQIDLVSNRIIGLFCSRPSLYRNLQFDQQNCLDQWLLGMAVVPYSDGLVK